MSMTPEEIDKIYIQEHGMTKGAFSVGLLYRQYPRYIRFFVVV